MAEAPTPLQIFSEAATRIGNASLEEQRRNATAVLGMVGTIKKRRPDLCRDFMLVVSTRASAGHTAARKLLEQPDYVVKMLQKFVAGEEMYDKGVISDRSLCLEFIGSWRQVFNFEAEDQSHKFVPVHRALKSI